MTDSQDNPGPSYGAPATALTPDELHLLERLLEATSSSTLVLAADRNFTIVSANAAYLQATLTRLEDIAGRPLF